MVAVDFEYRDNDGAAWFTGDRIVVNIKWLNIEDEAVWYIDESFIHEYIEHVLGLGHEAAVYVERVLRRLLYREWFGVCPTEILYGEDGGGASSSSAPPAREAHRLSLSLPRGGQAPPLSPR